MHVIKFFDCLSDGDVIMTIFDDVITMKLDDGSVKVITGTVNQEKLKEFLQWVEVFGTTLPIPLQVANRIAAKLMPL